MKLHPEIISLQNDTLIEIKNEGYNDNGIPNGIAVLPSNANFSLVISGAPADLQDHYADDGGKVVNIKWGYQIRCKSDRLGLINFSAEALAPMIIMMFAANKRYFDDPSLLFNGETTVVSLAGLVRTNIEYLQKHIDGVL